MLSKGVKKTLGRNGFRMGFSGITKIVSCRVEFSPSWNIGLLLGLDYNPVHNILELYNVLVQVRVAISKTKLDIEKNNFTSCLTSFRTT